MATYYGHNNVKFTVANQSILVDNVSFSLGARISENQEINKRGNFEYIVENGHEGSLSLSYYLEGADPLLPYIASNSPFAFDAGGMTQEKAYLTSYSISATPFGPAKVSANLSIYDDFGGSFTPATLPDEERVYLKFSDMITSFQGINATSNIISMNYSVSKSVETSYLIGQTTPSDVKVGSVLTDLSLETYGFTEALPYNGKNVDVTFSLGPNEYLVNGIMEAKDIGFALSDKIKATLSVKSNAYGSAPTISNDAPNPVNVGQVLNIYGTNLENVTAIYFNNNIKANEFKTKTSTQLSVVVPRFSISGPYRVVTPHGEIIRPSISINNQTFIP